MKRFIDIGTQLYLSGDEGDREFAFYCTVKDRIETFNGSQTWASVQDFIEDYEGDELDRYLILIPDSWPTTPRTFLPIKESFQKLTKNERLEIFSDYCLICGKYIGESRCNCWNDE